MKKIIFIISFFLLVFLLNKNIFAEDQINGFEWEKLPKQVKLGYVMGYCDAQTSVYLFTMVYRMHQTNPNISSKVISYKDWLIENGFDFKGLSYGQIIDEVDKIYSDPRTKQWGLREIIPIATGRLKRGWTEKDMDEVISYKIKREEFFKKEKNLSDERVKEFDDNNKPKILKKLENY
jgi:hypothetical protein